MYKNCLNCGNEFEATNEKQKYCSDSCKTLAYNKRKNDRQFTDDFTVNNDDFDDDERQNENSFTLTFTVDEVNKISKNANICGLFIDDYLKTKTLIDEQGIKNQNKLIAQEKERHQLEVDILKKEIRELKVRLVNKDNNSIGLIDYGITEKQLEIIEKLLSSERSINEEMSSFTPPLSIGQSLIVSLIISKLNLKKWHIVLNLNIDMIKKNLQNTNESWLTNYIMPPDRILDEDCPDVETVFQTFPELKSYITCEMKFPI